MVERRLPGATHLDLQRRLREEAARDDDNVRPFTGVRLTFQRGEV